MREGNETDEVMRASTTLDSGGFHEFQLIAMNSLEYTHKGDKKNAKNENNS